VSVSIHVSICISVSVYLCLCLYMSLSVYRFLCICVCVYACLYLYICFCVSVSVSMHVSICISAVITLRDIFLTTLITNCSVMKHAVDSYCNFEISVLCIPYFVLLMKYDFKWVERNKSFATAALKQGNDYSGSP